MTFPNALGPGSAPPAEPGTHDPWSILGYLAHTLTIDGNIGPDTWRRALEVAAANPAACASTPAAADDA